MGAACVRAGKQSYALLSVTRTPRVMPVEDTRQLPCPETCCSHPDKARTNKAPQSRHQEASLPLTRAPQPLLLAAAPADQTPHAAGCPPQRQPPPPNSPRVHATPAPHGGRTWQDALQHLRHKGDARDDTEARHLARIVQVDDGLRTGGVAGPRVSEREGGCSDSRATVGMHQRWCMHASAVRSHAGSSVAVRARTWDVHCHNATQTCANHGRNARTWIAAVTGMYSTRMAMKSAHIAMVRSVRVL